MCVAPFALQGLLDLMIAEEEGLKNRLMKSIEACQEDLRVLYSELQLPPFEVQSPPGSVGFFIFTLPPRRLTRLVCVVLRRRKDAPCCRWRRTAARVWR